MSSCVFTAFSFALWRNSPLTIIERPGTITVRNGKNREVQEKYKFSTNIRSIRFDWRSMRTEMWLKDLSFVIWLNSFLAIQGKVTVILQCKKKNSRPGARFSKLKCRWIFRPEKPLVKLPPDQNCHPVILKAGVFWYVLKISKSKMSWHLIT